MISADDMWMHSAKQDPSSCYIFPNKSLDGRLYFYVASKCVYCRNNAFGILNIYNSQHKHMNEDNVYAFN